MTSDKKIIGREALVNLGEHAKSIPAKVDTGADSSALWASDIYINPEGELCYKMFGEGSEFFTGEEIRTKRFTVASVTSASGHKIIKFCPYVSMNIDGVEIETRIGLSNRKVHRYPILIGRRDLKKGNFLVDVAKELPGSRLIYNRARLRAELKKNPYEFYKKYFINEEN